MEAKKKGQGKWLSFAIMAETRLESLAIKFCDIDNENHENKVIIFVE